MGKSRLTALSVPVQGDKTLSCTKKAKSLNLLFWSEFWLRSLMSVKENNSFHRLILYKPRSHSASGSARMYYFPVKMTVALQRQGSASSVMQPNQEETLCPRSLSPGNTGTGGITVETLHCKRRKQRRWRRRNKSEHSLNVSSYHRDLRLCYVLAFSL